MKVLGTVFLTGTVLLAGNAAHAVNATPATPASTAITAQSSAPTSVKTKSRKSKRFFTKCRKSRRFNERRVGYGTNAILGGRCITSKVRGVKLVSSYGGHHPSAARAIDVMINMSGSCRAGRRAGNQVARYFMKNSGKHRVQYIIWKNGYWQAGTKRKKSSSWRKMSRGGNCTTRHYDHVHVAFR